jgi:hypothetical protein
MQMNEENMDEFGRNLLIKKEPSYIEYLQRFKGMLWSDICFTIEEEEENIKKSKEKDEFRKTLAQRKQLVEQGIYQLEEGEIVDL